MLSSSIWFSAPSFWMGGGLENRCVGRVYGAVRQHSTVQKTVQKTICCNSTSNAPDDGRMYPEHVELRIHSRHHPHRTHDISSQDHHPSKNSVQKTICWNSTSNAPDDGSMYPKHVELRIHPRHHPHRTHDPRSGSQDHHPSKNSVQETICWNSTSNAPDDGRMYPKHVELRIHQ